MYNLQDIVPNHLFTLYRGPGFEPYKMIRLIRKDVYGDTTGVLMEDGQRWHEVRSKVQQDLMRPKSATFYLDEISRVSQDFVKFIRAKRDQDTFIINNFLPEIYRLTLEAICLITIEKRIGCLNPTLDPEIAIFFESVKSFLNSFPDMVSKFLLVLCGI